MNTIIVRVPVPGWVRNLAKELADFRDHRNSWLMDAWYDNGGAPPSFARRAVLTADLILLRYWMPVLCAIAGHELIDDDPGDPEVGPQPHIYCTRCMR